MYRAHFGTPGCGISWPDGKGAMASRAFSDLAEALVWAERIAKQGNVVVAIDGVDGPQSGGTEVAWRLGRSLA